MNPELGRLMAGGHLRIPTLPKIVSRLEGMLTDPNSGVTEIGEIIDLDPPVAARVLKIANSVFYGPQGAVRSTSQATVTIGTRVLRTIVLQSSLMEQYDHLRATPEFDPEELWKHSIMTAQLASYVAAQTSLPQGFTKDAYYSCGLLHDFGKIILLDTMGDEYLDVILDAKRSGEPIHVSERELLGFDHAELGGVMAHRWGLPKSTADAIHDHHEVPGPGQGDSMVPIVSLANILASAAQAGDVVAAQEVVSTSGIRGKAGEKLVQFAIASWPLIQL